MVDASEKRLPWTNWVSFNIPIDYAQAVSNNGTLEEQGNCIRTGNA
jgi:hypothetical protein